MAARCTTPAVAMHHSSGDDAPSSAVRLHCWGGVRILVEIAKKYKKTTAQIMLRWHIQRGVVVIPKSTHKEHMEENLKVFDFILDQVDMNQISKLDKKQSSFFSHNDPAMVEWFVRMVEERKEK